MKLSVIILTTISLQIGFAAKGQNISIKEKGVSLEKLFLLLQEKGGYNVIYESNTLQSGQRFDVDVKHVPVTEVLNVYLRGKNLSYTIDGKTIFIKKKEIGKNALEQQRAISGTVTDKNGRRLPGVSVNIQRATDPNKNTSVSTDLNGQFTIRAEESDVLTFTCIGFKKKNITVQRNNIINVQLEDEISNIDDVVVVGYGTQKLGEITGSIAVIDEKELSKRIVGTASFDQALGGLAKGLMVSDNNGMPGAGASINIRGFTSPFAGGSNQPLFVLDGVIINTDAQFSTGGETAFTASSNPLLGIDPSNIESISVLKDAAATAIYGSRGANGVIIVTTKKGKAGEKAQVNLSFTESFGKPIRQLQTMNTQEFKTFTDLLLRNTVKSINNGEQSASRLTPYLGVGLADLTYNSATKKYSYNGLIDSYFGSADMNWFDEIYRSSAKTKQANLNIRGGTDRTTYALGGTFFDQEGIMINSDLRQYNFNVGVNTFLTKSIETGVSLNLNSNIRNTGSDYNNSVSAQFYATARPDLPVYDANGGLLRQPAFDYGPDYLMPNPVAQMNYQMDMRAQNLIGNTFVSFEPIERLKFKASLNVGSFLTKSNQFSPQITLPYTATRTFESTLSVSDVLQTNYITELSGVYNFSLNDDHIFHTTAGLAWDRTNVKRTYNFYQGFPDDEILNNVNNASSSLAWGGGQIESGMNSTFARINYSYLGRYLATANARSDASSKFGPGNKRGFFPAISLGWVIDKESFFNHEGALELLKLRASAGKTGSSNIADFAYYQFFQKGFRGSGQYGGLPAVEYASTLPNPNISWETTYDYNAGVDFTFKNQWLSGTLDVYYRNTPNSIAATPFSVELGPTDYSSNLMHLTNKGAELQLDANILRKADGLNWNASLNLALNRNKIISLNNATIDTYLQDNFIEGQPLGTIKGYVTDGIFQSQQEINDLNTAAKAKHGPGAQYDLVGTGTGDYKMVDTNGDGRITTDDRVVLGNIEPKYFGGFSNSFSYKGFELSAFFQFVVGNKMQWSNSVARVTPLYNNLTLFDGTTWTEERPDAKYPRVVYGNPGQNNRTNDQQIFDASYFRLKTLHFSYSFNGATLQKYKVSNLSLFASASNLFTISNWPGTDPGAISSGSVTGRTSNRDPYPLAKNMSLGINVQF